MEPGDNLLMLTDGAMEAWGREDPAGSYDRMIRLLDPGRPDRPNLNKILEDLAGRDEAGAPVWADVQEEEEVTA